VVEVSSRAGWYRFEERLRAHGLRNDSSSRVICRWKAGSPGDELVVDLMPGTRRSSVSRIGGNGLRWTMLRRCRCRPASGYERSRRPTCLRPSWRRGGDAEAATTSAATTSRTLIRLVDGRAEVVGEVGDASADLRSFLSREIATLLDQSRFMDAIDGTVIGFGRGRSSDGDRVEEIVLPRLRALAGR
jgi:hypothetical protein